jgi:membrane protein
MEGTRRKQQEQIQHERGQPAESPADISKPGWRDVARRTKEGIREDNLSIIAAGTAFFLLLGLVPGLAALISIYGLIAQPSDIQAQFNALSGAVPAEVRTILQDQMTRIADARGAAGLAGVVGLLLALWGGAAAMKSVMNALNIIYREEERRGYVKLTLVALALTLALIVIAIVAVGSIVILPPILARVGLGDAAKLAISVLRWPFLFVVALLGLAVLYRYAPCREKPEWKWVSPGAVVATVLWLLGSGLFALYAQHFGTYNKTYGSLGAIVVLMLWMYISAFALLIGAEVNARSERHAIEPSATPEPEAGTSDRHGRSRT